MSSVSDEDELMMVALDGGASDVVADGEHWRVESEPSDVSSIVEVLEGAGYAIVSADAPLVADNSVPVSDVETARKIIRVMSAIEDNDDVQDVFANFDMADELLEEAAE